MPGSHLDLVTQRIPTVLGPLQLALPAGTALPPDPGADEGSECWRSPHPGAATLTISDGEAGLRAPAALLDLERSLANVDVVVLRDEPGAGEGEHELEFLSSSTPSHRMSTQRARFRFF